MFKWNISANGMISTCGTQLSHLHPPPCSPVCPLNSAQCFTLQLEAGKLCSAGETAQAIEVLRWSQASVQGCIT